jgi:hypothetical protein
MWNKLKQFSIRIMEILLNGQALFGWTYEQEELVEHMMKRILILPNSKQLIQKVRQHVSDPKAYSSWIVTCGNIFSVEIYKILLHTLEESKENSKEKNTVYEWMSLIYSIYPILNVAEVSHIKHIEKVENYCKPFIYDNMEYDEKALNKFQFNPDNVMNQIIWDKSLWSIQLMERRLFELIFKKIIDKRILSDKRILRDALKYVQSNLKRFDIDTTGYETLKEIAEEILFVIEDAGIEAIQNL